MCVLILVSYSFGYRMSSGQNSMDMISQYDLYVCVHIVQNQLSVNNIQTVMSHEHISLVQNTKSLTGESLKVY